MFLLALADVPSNESVMSQTIVRALSLPKAAWDKLQEQYPQQARLVLANLQVGVCVGTWGTCIEGAAVLQERYVQHT